VCRGRSNACNPLALRIDKNLGNPVVKKVWVRTLADRRGIHLLSVNTARSPVGATVITSVGTSRCEATRAARCRSIRACREHWPERRWHHGTEGPAVSAWAGVGTGCDRDRSWPDRPPRVKLVAVGDAHEVAVPCDKNSGSRTGF
jgi:hypothetical protein